MTLRPTAHRRLRFAGVVAASLLALGACGDEGATVSFTEPGAGERVAGGVAFALRADGVTIEPAGEVRDGAGHFHVLADAGCADPGDAIAKDVDHVHLGKGQADGVIYLGPGEHELCVQVGDGAHVAQDVTDTVTVEVGIEDRDGWCAVIEEVDARFEEVDTAGGEFTDQKTGYTGIGRLLDQLAAAIDQVDADARADVGDAIDNAKEITDAYATAEDLDEAEANFEEIFARGEPVGTPQAAAWISDACDVDIDG